MQLTPGQWAPNFDVRDIHNHRLALQQFGRHHVLLSFNKWTTCPFSSLRMMRLTKHYDSLRAAGLQIIAFYHTPLDNVRQRFNEHPVPFPVIADSSLTYYDAYGIERSMWRYVLSWARLPSMFAILRHGFFTKTVDGDPFLLPADFLIGPDLRIKIAHYGRDWGDHLSLKSIRTYLQQYAELHGTPEPIR